MLKQLTVVAALLLLPVQALAQQDDCPPNHIRNPQVSPLDHEYMVKAFTASFYGIFGRLPSMQPGSGKDDGEYYIAAANHFGVYGDDQCHAGWSGYWESWLEVGHGDLGRVQTPAHFLPFTAPPVVTPPGPVVVPPVLPSVDLSGIYTQLQMIDARLTNIASRIEEVNVQVQAGREENKSFFARVGGEWKRILTYAAPIVGALFAGRAVK